MLIPSLILVIAIVITSLSRRVNANSQHGNAISVNDIKLIKKGEC